MLGNIFLKETNDLNRTPIVQQTAFWSDVKTKLGDEALAMAFSAPSDALFKESSRSRKMDLDVLVMLKPLNRNHSIAYVPYGPEIEPDEEVQGAFLEELSECLRPFLPEGCVTIRYDLCWESYWTKQHHAAEDLWQEEPEKRTQEVRFNFTTMNWNFRKTHFNILPAHTIYLDLTQSLPRILERMKPKTRYNIGLAKRKGVTVRHAGHESLQVWYNLYRETALRNRILVNELKYFEVILTARVEHSSSPAEVQLLIAEWDGIPLAAMFLVMSDHRAFYLYGASSSQHRNLMATYALQWEAISIAKSKCCTEYDMFGTAPSPNKSHPLYGLYKFKSGFGGSLYHRLGCWDYPLDPANYDFFRNEELLSQGFHLK